MAAILVISVFILSDSLSLKVYQAQRQKFQNKIVLHCSYYYKRQIKCKNKYASELHLTCKLLVSIRRTYSFYRKILFESTSNLFILAAVNNRFQVMNKHFMPQSKTTALLFSSAKYYYLVVLNITSKQDVIQIFIIFIAHITFWTFWTLIFTRINLHLNAIDK